MSTIGRVDATTDVSQFDNAYIGEGAIIEPDVMVGFRYQDGCGRATLGKGAMLRKGTVIYGDVKIGDYFQSGYYSVIRALVKMGDYCVIMNQTTLEGIVRFGTGVRVMSHVYIPSRTWIGDHVFIGPGVTFLNDKYPGRRDPMPTPRGATVRDDVMIGGGCTILPGVTIGERSFIAAGAVVTKDIPPRSLVIGNPGVISPLPAKLDMANTRKLTMAPRSMWHPELEYGGAKSWPTEWWGEAWE